MSDLWDAYQSTSHDSPCVVRLDLGIREEAPIQNANKLAKLHIQTKSLFSKKLNFDLVNEIEDVIYSQLTENDFYVGAITRPDTRSFYIYTKDEDTLRNTLESIVSRYKKIQVDLSFEEDAEWGFYLQELYPDQSEDQWVLDRDVMDQIKRRWVMDKSVTDQLEKHNDASHIPREVLHWIYFMDEESREAFKKEVSKSGYQIVEENKLEEEQECAYQLLISHISAVDLDTINKATTRLLTAAQAVGGNYDGWETQIVKSG